MTSTPDPFSGQTIDVGAKAEIYRLVQQSEGLSEPHPAID